MAAWLAGLGVTNAAIESTPFWRPVHHALFQAEIGVCVCNAAHMRHVPSRKRDVSDCQWIAELHEFGLLLARSSRPARSPRCGSPRAIGQEADRAAHQRAAAAVQGA